MKEVTDWQFERIPAVYPEMVTSLLTHTCIERGRDISDGGVDYNSVVVQFAGLANVADSLTAVKEFVYKRKLISLNTLRDAVQADFAGYEELRRLLLSAPKFGNDDAAADESAVTAAELFRKVLSRYRSVRGGIYRPAFFSWAGHAYAEEYLGAGADGRKSSEPISQGPNPMHGRNSKGITATARSVSKLDFPRNAGGPLQLEMNPSLLNLDDPALFVMNLAVPYFRMKGAHVYINVVSSQTLQAAMENPEAYGHIVVRVTGFSVHFVQLDRKIQEEIIKRTRHDVA
jgi:formate C-acetyltransferase